MANEKQKLASYLACPQEILDLIPGNFGWKSREGIYLGCNQSLVKATSSTSNKNDILGRSVQDLVPKEHALTLLENDHYVMTNDCEMVFEEVFFAPGNELAITYLSQKTPLHDENGKVVGVIILAINVTQCSNLQEVRNRVAGNFAQNAVTSNTTALPSHVLLKKLLKQLDAGRYYLPIPFDNVYLTQRELDCLLALLEGKSAKQIARDLALSPRTVEFYVHKIKTKFNCRTILELIGHVTSIISTSKALKSVTNF
jgi:DNA-binding CsgD family transcriptional regulator